MKVLFAVGINSFLEREIAQLKKEFPNTEFLTGKLTGEELAKVDVLLGGKIDPLLIEEAVALQLVVVPFVGVNHLPLELMKSRKVRVANSHGNSFAVAEKALAMTLAFYGRVVEFHNDLREEKWHGFWVDKGLDDSWTSLQGKRVVVLGTGEIGKVLVRLLEPFQCKVLGFKRNPAEEGELKRLYGFDEITYSLDYAVQWGEVVVSLLPLTGSTRGMIDRRVLSLMKDKFLVNLGRAEVVDEAALYEALSQKILLGAALDPWYNYPPKGEVSGAPSRYPIHKLPNVILSPHTGGYTPQAAKLNMEHALANLRSYLKTGELVYEVNLQEGY